MTVLFAVLAWAARDVLAGSTVSSEKRWKRAPSDVRDGAGIGANRHLSDLRRDFSFVAEAVCGSRFRFDRRGI